MGDRRVDVETSVTGFINQLDDDQIDRVIDNIGEMRSGIMLFAHHDSSVSVEAFTTIEDGEKALVEAVSLYGGMAIECHRRFVAAVLALREQFGREVDDAPDSGDQPS